MADLLKKVLSKELDRRTFLKGGAAVTAAAALGLSLTGTDNALVMAAAPAPDEAGGKWVSSACWNNCGGRCVNKALVVDGVVIRQKTDDTHPDSPDYPQVRACLRGRSQRKDVFGASRIKYPMKRKNWSPGGGDKSLRGRDEWERISWDEALDYVAAEIKSAHENYGPNSIISFARTNATRRTLFAYGGTTTHWDTTSLGTYSFPVANIGVKASQSCNDRFDLRNADYILLQGTNVAWSSSSLQSYSFLQAKNAGAQFIFVGPRYCATAAAMDARWIPVRPGTDVALLLAVAYTLIAEDDPVNNPMIDWDCLNRCTFGFDSAHMPAGAKIRENFKDYLLGKYDGIPKTPEWAQTICGTPVEDIIFYARTIRKDNKVTMLHGYAPARNSGAEDFPQMFATLGFMTGHMGKPGHACGNAYKAQSNTGPTLVRPGGNGLPSVSNPVDDCINGPNMWPSILEGRYLYTGSSKWLPGEWRDIDIRVVYTEDKSPLQGVPSMTYGIEAHRTKLDFVVSQAFTFNTQAKYADIILPVTTMWERPGVVLNSNADREVVLVYSQVVEPMYEAKSDQWIGEELAKRLGLDVKEIFPFDEKQQFFNQIAGSEVLGSDKKTYEPLVTITAADIAAWGVEGEPQTGRIGLQEFIDRGVYQYERKVGDGLGTFAFKSFVADPEGNPLDSKSGKFDIYSDWKSDTMNAVGHADMDFKPYPSYTIPPVSYQEQLRDVGDPNQFEYPFVITNVHYLRRVHNHMDNVGWLREAMTSPATISVQDAEAKGVKSGDTILIWTPHGKALRPACVSECIMPGVIELTHGGWVDMDEATGIDQAGADNILGGPITSSIGVSGYNNYVGNFIKYDGPQMIPDCEKPEQAIRM